VQIRIVGKIKPQILKDCERFSTGNFKCKQLCQLHFSPDAANSHSTFQNAGMQHLITTIGLQKSGENCNSNCIYDKNIDYWFWAGKDKRCSFCGLGQEHGFGTQHPIPENEGPRLLLFEKVKEGTTLEEPDEIYNARFDEAAACTIEGLWRRLVWQMQEPKNRFRIQNAQDPAKIEIQEQKGSATIESKEKDREMGPEYSRRTISGSESKRGGRQTAIYHRGRWKPLHGPLQQSVCHFSSPPD